VDGFDPVTFFMGEDARVAYDLVAAGWGLSYCSDVVALHDPAPGREPDRVRLADRNKALTSWMRRPVSVALRESATWLASPAAAASWPGSTRSPPRPTAGRPHRLLSSYRAPEEWVGRIPEFGTLPKMATSSEVRCERWPVQLSEIVNESARAYAASLIEGLVACRCRLSQVASDHEQAGVLPLVDRPRPGSTRVMMSQDRSSIWVRENPTRAIEVA
jgi:hypothetical protein